MIRSRLTTRRTISFAIIAVFSLVLALIIRSRYLDYFYQLEKASSTEIIRATQPTPLAIAPNLSSDPVPVATTQSVILPLQVPFTTQAPLAVWDQLHEEACEEASLLMVYYYRTGQRFATALEADNEIKKLIAWEEANDYGVDLTASELVAVAASYLNLKSGRVIISPTVEQLKSELRFGRPVIVPAAGRELRNPYFTAPGPVYHMLVLKSYDEAGFIVNDPGTRRGESYFYAFERIMDSMHDWDPTNILNGQKAVVVFD